MASELRDASRAARLEAGRPSAIECAIVNDMVPRDTTPAAAAVQEEAYRRVGPVGRFQMALELSDLTHEFALAGIRLRHPHYSLEEAKRALAIELYGEAAPVAR